MKRGKKKVFMTLGTILLIGIVLGGGAFYMVIASGWFPTVQELWVTTAMTTLNHKWLATWFIDSSTIDEIMKRTYVDDSFYATEADLVHVPYEKATVDKLDVPVDSIGEQSQREQYTIGEGYTFLEDGIYTKEVGGNMWKGYILMVTDPRRISLVDTEKQFEEGQTVKKMVEVSGAIAGINAGGFADGPNYNSNGGQPAGLLMKKGEVINPKKEDQARHSIVGFNQDHILVIERMTIAEARQAGVWDCVEFRPSLIVNGEPIIKEGQGGWGIAPRTALGQRVTGEVLFLVVDGRQPTYSIGVDLRVLQDVLFKEGCINAGMVDGGSSTAMVYQGEYINKPSLGHERKINNCWVIH
ncbi:MAG: phosphodiester glycosidase family protein [Cellulosilyticaceae bacterium]